jgi:HEAT repeat protein
MYSIRIALVALAIAPAVHAVPALAIGQDALATITAVAGPAPAPANGALRLPPESWAPQDPADSVWRAARRALDAGNAREAAALYRRIRTERRFAQSEYRSHAYYWEAFARQRIGGTTELQAARSVLAELRREYPRFENMTEVERLLGRVNGELASSGDRAATEQINRQMAEAGQCPDQELRVAVVEALLMTPTEQAMPTLKAVMSRRDGCSAELREKAVFIISQKRSTEAEDMLLEAARNDPSPKVREQAVFWLSQVNSDKAVTAIEEILRTSNEPKMLEQAVFALSQHRSPRAAQILRDIATRPNTPAEARKNAIFWLGQSKSADVSGFLRSLYSSLNDRESKEAVLFALSQNRAEGNADFLLQIASDSREPGEMRKQALFWAAQQGALPLARLGELYQSMPDREMREQIIFAISQRREPEAVDRLMEIVRRERDVELRKNAIFWLGQSRDPRAARFLAELIGG